uniref:Tyr recombinase domain-containing protein n=1 Tax=Anoplophora glabripennis TaxID=217634 RepID=V5I9S5_ANOGL
MIKSTLQSNNNVDISKYCKLTTILKRNGYMPKKYAIFTSTHISDFSNNAPDEVYLMAKVVVFGIAEACRICEISQVRLDDIEDSGTLLIVKLKQTKNDVNRRFVVTEEYVKFYLMYT